MKEDWLRQRLQLLNQIEYRDPMKRTRKYNMSIEEIERVQAILPVLLDFILKERASRSAGHRDPSIYPSGRQDSAVDLYSVTLKFQISKVLL